MSPNDLHELVSGVSECAGSLRAITRTILSPATRKALTASPFLYRELNLLLTGVYLSRGSSSSSSSSPSSWPGVAAVGPSLGPPFRVGVLFEASGSFGPSPSAIRRFSNVRRLCGSESSRETSRDAAKAAVKPRTPTSSSVQGLGPDDNFQQILRVWDFCISREVAATLFACLAYKFAHLLFCPVTMAVHHVGELLGVSPRRTSGRCTPHPPCFFHDDAISSPLIRY